MLVTLARVVPLGSATAAIVIVIVVGLRGGARLLAIKETRCRQEFSCFSPSRGLRSPCLR